MKEWTIQIPVEGVIIVKICSDTPDEALRIFYDKQEQLLYHHSGLLKPIHQKLLVYTTDDEIIN